MVKHRAAAEPSESLWFGGLSMADFEVPSKPHAVAQAASAIAAVTLDLSDAITTGEIDDGELSDLVNTGWVEAADDKTDYAERKTLWPVLDPLAFAPADSVSKRIKDNIAAVRAKVMRARSTRCQSV